MPKISTEMGDFVDVPNNVTTKLESQTSTLCCVSCVICYVEILDLLDAVSWLKGIASGREK